MSVKLNEALRVFLIRGFVSTRSSNINGINDWLLKGSYFINLSPSATDFIIDVVETQGFLSALAYDVNRLSLASLESLNNVRESELTPRFMGWNLINYYYSAFFSMHCMLKLFNCSLSNVDKQTVTFFGKVISTYGFSDVPQSGLYQIKVVGNTINFKKSASAAGGSHENAWRNFLNLLNEMSSAQSPLYNALTTAQAQIVVDKLEELKKALSNKGANEGQWFSQVRNIVNYSQGLGVWFPYAINKKNANDILALKTLSSKDSLEIELGRYSKNDIEYFVRSCQMINSICYTVLSDLKNINHKSFVDTGIHRYYNTYLDGKTSRLIPY
jgi:hypothetical protein